MPKGFTAAEREIGEAIKGEATEKGRRLYPEEIERIIDTHDVEFIGSGGEHALIAREGKPEEVIAFRFEDLEPKEAERLFYFQRIASTLFPHNFPHFHIVTKHDKGEEVVDTTVQRRIRGRKAREDYGENLDPQAKHPFQKVLDTCYDLELPIMFDLFMENFALGEDGGVYYLDTVQPIRWREWNLPVIRKFMDEAKNKEGRPTYTRKDKRIVEKSIRRLAALGLTKIVE